MERFELLLDIPLESRVLLSGARLPCVSQVGTAVPRKLQWLSSGTGAHFRRRITRCGIHRWKLGINCLSHSQLKSLELVLNLTLNRNSKYLHSIKALCSVVNESHTPLMGVSLLLSVTVTREKVKTQCFMADLIRTSIPRAGFGSGSRPGEKAVPVWFWMTKEYPTGVQWCKVWLKCFLTAFRLGNPSCDLRLC